MVASAPFVEEQGMLSLDDAVRGVIVRGVLPAEEEKVADFGSYMRAGSSMTCSRVLSASCSVRNSPRR